MVVDCTVLGVFVRGVIVNVERNAALWDGG